MPLVDILFIYPAESEGFEPPKQSVMHFLFLTVGFRQLLILFVCLAGKIVSRFCPCFVPIPTLWKSAAKVLLFFDMCKFFSVFLQKKLFFNGFKPLHTFSNFFPKIFQTLGKSIKFPINGSKREEKFV